MTLDAYPRLLADVGGTTARFASQFEPGGPLAHFGSYVCADFETLWDAISHHLWREGLSKPRAAAIGIATAVSGDHVRMTNHPWAFSIKAMQEALGLERLLVLNDFTALALALPHLPASALRQAGGGAAEAGAPLALIGPCTGLGVSGLLPAGDGSLVPLRGEGGHASLSASFEPEEALVLQLLSRKFGYVSAERALSRPGLENLYLALAEVRGVTAALPARGKSISAAALAGGDPLAESALLLFSSLLGNVAGNLVLTLGARGGLFIGGGIVPGLGDWFVERSAFRAGFEDKGRFRAYLQDVPAFIIQATDEATLLGASRALDAALR